MFFINVIIFLIKQKLHKHKKLLATVNFMFYVIPVQFFVIIYDISVFFKIYCYSKYFCFNICCCLVGYICTGIQILALRNNFTQST